MTSATQESTSALSATEQQILEAIEARQVADLSMLQDEQRHVTAGFLQYLVSGAHGALCRPLRIRGAFVVGPLRLPTTLPDSGHMAVQFRDCSFDSPVDVSGGEFLALRLVDCTLPAFIGASLRVVADLDLSGSRFSGVRDYESELGQVGNCAIHLNNARIGGKLDLSSTAASRFRAFETVRLDGARIEGSISLGGALLDGAGTAALSARAVTVGNNVDLVVATGHRFEANGEVIFAAATIAGDLNCDGASLSNPQGRALHCEDLQVESVFLTSSEDPEELFEARGRVNFLTATIGGSFFLTKARLAPGPDYDGLLRKGGPVAINLQQARVSNALALRNVDALGGEPGTPVRGWFLLSEIQVTSILDNSETGWPAAGFLDIDGATYNRCHHVEGGDLVAQRIKWLRRQYPGGVPDPASFRPQPYEQLARVLRQHGQTQEANAIAVEKIRARLTARVDRLWSRMFSMLLMLVSQYGYSTGRALSSFLAFVLLGSAMYTTALMEFQQPFLPAENPPEPVSYSLAFGLVETEVRRGCPGLDVFHYALDAALPVIDLAQDMRCRFTPEGPWRWLWLILHSAYVIMGAALSAVVILTLTGLLKRD